MSAYIVDKNHILYLVDAAMNYPCVRHGSHKMGWFWNDDWHYISVGDYDRAAEVANMLWMENVKSVSARYPNESSATLPGPRGVQFVIEPKDFGPIRWLEFEPTQIIKSCDCYAYQSCEHTEWEKSEPYAFILALRAAAWHGLPKYEPAVWGAPPVTTRRVVSLTAL